MFEHITDEETGVTHIVNDGRKLCGVPAGSYRPGEKPDAEQFGCTCHGCQSAVVELCELVGIEADLES